MQYIQTLSMLALATGLLGGPVQAPPAQTATPAAPAPAVAAGALARLPFSVGEKASYQVKLGAVPVGSGSMELVTLDTIQGNEVLHARLAISGGVPLARVNDKFESWIDPDGLFSRRFKQDQKEVSYKRKRHFEFNPEARTFRQVDNGETGVLPTDQPLDEVSMLYYARTLPLEVGHTYTIPRYFKKDANPVVLKVLRKERVTVPAGTFNTVVVRPIIKTKGLFGEGGQAEVYFSDDSRRILVQLTSKVPVVGSLNLYLREYDADGE